MGWFCSQAIKFFKLNLNCFLAFIICYFWYLSTYHNWIPYCLGKDKCIPASEINVSPVICSPPSKQKKITDFAISSGVPALLKELYPLDL